MTGNRVGIINALLSVDLLDGEFVVSIMQENVVGLPRTVVILTKHLDFTIEAINIIFLSILL